MVNENRAYLIDHMRDCAFILPHECLEITVTVSFVTEMCEDFFCSRCKQGWVHQYKGGNKCLANCPSGFYRREDVFSDQPYCDSE